MIGKMDSGESPISIDTLFNSDCIGLLKLFMESGVLSPSQIMADTKMTRGKTYICLNKLLKNRLIRKIGKGKYEISENGRRLLNILAIYSLGGGYVFDVAGKLGVDEYIDILRSYLGGAFIDKYLPSIADAVKEGRITSQEEVILLLSHLMLRSDEDISAKDLSKRLLFIKDFSREAIVRDIHRKLVEHSFHNRILRLFMESVAKPEELAKSTPQPYNIYCRELEDDPYNKYIVYSPPSLATDLGYYQGIILNVDWFSYGDSVYAIIRKMRGKIKYVLRELPEDAYDDELTLNMILNDSNKGVGVYLHKSICSDIIVDDDGFCMPLDKLNKSFYNLSRFVVDTGKIGVGAIDTLSSSIFIRSLITYIDNLRRFYGLSRDNNVVIHICLKGLERDMDLKWFIDWIQFIQDGVAEKNVVISPYLYTDFMEASDQINSICRSLGYVGYPPKKYRPLDIFDLKYLLKKILGMDYAFFNLVS